MTNALATWFANNLGRVMPAELVIFIVSLLPILECRGGLIVAALLGVRMEVAVPICVIGNFLPIPFILLFIKRIFKWLKKFGPTEKVVTKLEDRAMNKSDALENGEFIGLMLFVGIPLPGTGGWTGSLIAALLDVEFKKALVAEVIGILIATVIMSIVSYGLLAQIL